MTEQPTTLAETADSVRHTVASQKLEYLLRALNQLKSDISDVEARHPGFGSELSSLCATVIAGLNSLNSNDSADQPGDRDNLNVTSDTQIAIPALIPSAKHGANPVTMIIDKTGSHLITGLDKTGDGIIFILGKLFANHDKKAKPGTPAKAD